LIVLLGAAAFGRVAKFEFLNWDDYETVSENPQLKPPTSRSFASFWTRPQMGLYIPVTYTVWAFFADAAVDVVAINPQNPTGTAVATLDPRVFHTLNLALHLAAGAIVFLLLRDLRMSDLGALAGALLFVVHPMQVEPVAWVSGMKDLLMGVLALAAVWQYVRLARDETEGSLVPRGEWWGRYAAASTFFALAMLSKPTAVVTPAVAIVLDRFIVGRPWKKTLAWTWPWIVMAVPIAVVAKFVQPAGHAGAIWSRPLIAADALAFYVYKLVYPARLGIDYGRTPEAVVRNGWIWWTWVAPLVIAVALFVLRKRFRAGVAGGLVFLLALLPVLGLIRVDSQSLSTVADHYLYLAMLGPALALAWIVSRHETPLTLGLAGAILLALGVRTFYQTPHWKNSGTLARHAQALNPDSVAANLSFATEAMVAKNYGEAVEFARLAIQLNPRYGRAYLRRADAYYRAGNAAAAMEDYRRTLELLPDNAAALSNLALLLAQAGRPEEALPFAARAVQAAPDLLDARLNLARLHLELNDARSARAQIDAVLALDPSNPAALGLRSRVP
jgi:tetratricopeptide (TPR) repeat protein